MEHAEPPPPPSPSRLPWDFHPALTEERLRICARMLANSRRDALAMASYELGDDPWSVGCRAFAFGRHRLQRAASSGDYPWLEVLDDSAHFVFVIGGNGNGVPVRFYRGAAEEPTERTLKRQEVEVQQLSLALRGEDRVECFWPVPLELPAEAAPGAAVQLRLIADDGYAGSDETASRLAPLPPALPRRKPVASSAQRPQTTLF
ncbi:hypothetical protein JMJ56_27285 [Belnapia sp. T18]|uniref:Uncharacterized protein n=1 Tax=Belnapia arida TaxID=2804533 RepID=A0ABS1UAI3_9PROT|nr:hypothetical protein [Belnapia arida]MBL6081692.1 hypothetical protein [Belnapia arida]